MIRLLASGRAVNVSVDTLRRGLIPTSYVYLALPVAIFLLGWLRILPGVLLTAALAFSVFAAARSGARGGPKPDRALSVAWLAAALVPMAAAIAWGALGVAADFNGDWSQRFEIIRDVVRQPWPVIYETSTGPLALVYYLAWYLPAVLVMKLAGWDAGLLALLVWSVAGLTLVAGWLVVLARANPLLVIVAFLAFSGVGLWENLVDDGLWNTLQKAARGTSFAWQDDFWYEPILANFFRAPPHAIPAWLLASLAVDAADRRDAAFPVSLVLALGLLWSPMVALGLVPLVAVPVLCAPGPLATRLRAQLGAASVAGGVVGLVLLFYFVSRWYPYTIPAVYLEGVVTAQNGFRLGQAGVEAGPFLATWALFCATTFLGVSIPVLAARPAGRTWTPRGALAVAATLFLLFLPFFRYGYYNDLCHVASRPAFFVLALLAIDLLGRARRHPAAAAAVACVLVLGSVTTVGRTVRDAKKLRWLLETRELAAEPSTDLFQRQMQYVASGKGFDRIAQYVGSVDSPFFRTLTRPAAPRRVQSPPAGAPAPPRDPGR